MKVQIWTHKKSDKETAEMAYWERNMLALRYADGWYFDDVDAPTKDFPDHQMARYDGWRRVLSLDGGKITFHIPDDFDVGNLHQIQPNWDGHTTEEKWMKVAALRGIELEQP